MTDHLDACPVPGGCIKCWSVSGLCYFPDACPDGCRAEGIVPPSEKLAAGDAAPETVLQEAQRLVYGDRARDYGDALPEAEKVAAGWSAIIGAHVEPEMYPLCMAWLKIIRQTNRAKRDNLTDLAGYAGVAEKIERDRARLPERQRRG